MSAWYHRVVLASGLQQLVCLLAKVCYGVQFYFATFLKTEDPIVVYQMGKVGSSTLFATLKELVPESTVYHVHHLTNEGLNDVERRSIKRKRAFPGPGYWEAKHLQHRLKESSGECWRLISLTRDPVARNLSGFFQSLPLWFANVEERFLTEDYQALFEELLAAFLQNYPHDKASQWFDLELNQVFNINVYDTEFDRLSGYTIYRRENVHLVIIRLEDLSSCYQQALHTFLGKETSCQPLVHRNEASQKEYNHLYRDFLNWLILPKDYLTSQYSTQYARHFYSEIELESFCRKWSKGQRELGSR